MVLVSQNTNKAEYCFNCSKQKEGTPYGIPSFKLLL